MTRPARILPVKREEYRWLRLILDKKKGLLIGGKDQAGLIGQDRKQWLEKPDTDLLDKGIRQSKTDSHSR